MKRDSLALLMDLPYSLITVYCLSNKHSCFYEIYSSPSPFFLFLSCEVTSFLEVGIMRNNTDILIFNNIFRAEKKFGDFHYIEKSQSIGQFWKFFWPFFSLSNLDLFLSIFLLKIYSKKTENCLGDLKVRIFEPKTVLKIPIHKRICLLHT